jgi:hypothetical protein
MFSEEQLEQLRSFPDIGRDDRIRYFTLTQADMAFVDPGRGRGPADRQGLAVQLCTLPWLGFVPDEVSSAPPVAVARLAERLGLDPDVTRQGAKALQGGHSALRQTGPPGCAPERKVPSAAAQPLAMGAARFE